MRSLIEVACLLGVLVALTQGAPAPQTLDSLQSSEIDPVHQASLAQDGAQLEELRNKRTVGVLRQLFPQVSQIVDSLIQQLTSQIFRVVGRAVLQQGGLGGGGSAAGSSSEGVDTGRKVSVVLPTFAPDLEGDDDSDEDEDNDTDNEKSSSSTTTSTTTSTTSSTQSLIASANNEDNAVADSQVRIARATLEENQEDQQAAASGGNLAQDLSNVDADDEEETRDKRFLSSDGHSGGGSGNFLFDLIRLVAGSGHSEDSDEKLNSAIDIEVGKGDGYTEGIPGPITRLFVIANRGIANLVQDLILRLAQTSERIVNFKARLITALI